ncbi:rho GTPase-activating protein 24-like isoform X2 [Apostichopus japonicus]|uniref:rho GTPase-activating protein 24-like isoform X2 n=1 Tax=Stichopus japonicus TaxID=307972 RepID=UPI003AB2899B
MDYNCWSINRNIVRVSQSCCCSIYDSMISNIPKIGKGMKAFSVSLKEVFLVPHRRMTDRSIVFSKEDVLHRGWLKKQGGPFRIWQRRFFILVADYMFYFAKEDDQRPLGYIPLRGNKVEKHPFNPEEPGKYLFEVKPGSASQGPLTSNHETFLLWAINTTEQEDWLQVIRRVMYGKRGGGIFGQSLSDTITHESTDTTRKIPLIVEQCVSYITKHGMKEEGIFRLPGRSTLVKELQERFDLGQKPDLDEIRPDVHTVASLFKLYLRQLPEPVIPFDHYDNFYNAINLLKRNEEEGKAQLIRELALLPRPNHFLLKYLCEFLHELQKDEKENRMSTMNLSTVFGPNIYKADSDEPNRMMETTTMSQRLMNLLIANHTDMFPGNNSIKFSESEGNVPKPVPPPRSKGVNKQSKPNNVTDIDLLKFIQTNNLRADSFQEGDEKQQQDKGDPWEQQLMQLSSAEDLDSLHKMVEATMCRRSVSSDVHLPLDRSVDSDQESIASGTSNAHDSVVYYRRGSEGQRSDSQDRPESRLSFVNPLVTMRYNGEGITKSVVPPPMGIDLTEGTPEHKRLSNHEENTGLVLLEEQVKALKVEIETQRKEYQQKLRSMEMKCNSLEIKLSNEEKGRQSAEERNKQLLKQINTFIEEYGASD